MLTRRNGILLGALVLFFGGLAFIKLPTPTIVLAAEDVVDLGGYTITNTILSTWIVIILMAIGTLLLYRRIRHVEAALVPSGFQNLVEMLLEWFFGMVRQVAGERGARRFFPVVASIFLFLLVGNWFGLFPWNNILGNTEDVRAFYLEELEEDAENFVADLGAGQISVGDGYVDDLNLAFGTLYSDPIPVEAAEQEEADHSIAGLLEGSESSGTAAAVRAAFRADPVAGGIADAELVEAIEVRLLAAGVGEAHLEESLLFNLPLPLAAIDDRELTGTVLHSGGIDIVPLKAEDFEFDPFREQLLAAPGSGLQGARLFDPSEEPADGIIPRAEGEIVAPVTINTAHIGIVLKREKEGLEPDEGVGLVLPWFRSIATDLNLPLAIALWALIFVQFWAVQTLGLVTNIGRFLGFGAAKAASGPMGLMVGILEIISELARLISFTFRLFGNIFAGEVVLFMSAFLVPFLAATVFYALEVFVGFIQAFVFAMLTLVFAVVATAHGEHEEGHETETESAPH